MPSEDSHPGHEWSKGDLTRRGEGPSQVLPAAGAAPSGPEASRSRTWVHEQEGVSVYARSVHMHVIASARSLESARASGEHEVISISTPHSSPPVPPTPSQPPPSWDRSSNASPRPIRQGPEVQRETLAPTLPRFPLHRAVPTQPESQERAEPSGREAG